jgi:hypothetical protein
MATAGSPTTDTQFNLNSAGAALGRVSSDVGLAEVERDLETGITVPASTPASIARAIDDANDLYAIIDDPVKRNPTLYHQGPRSLPNLWPRPSKP